MDLLKRFLDFCFGTSLYLNSLKHKLSRAEGCLQKNHSTSPFPQHTESDRLLTDVVWLKSEIERIQ